MSEEARYPFVVVDVAASLSDDASAELFELGAQGVEERDATTLLKQAGDAGVTLVASFGDHEEAAAALNVLKDQHPSWVPRLEEVVGDAWRDAWKEHFAPFALTPKITIRPPWHPAVESRPGVRVLELEPGRAFGTGLHATTGLVAEVLDARADALAGKRFLDLGCGSGILSLVALALGAGQGVAVDIDEEAIGCTLENAARNGMVDRIHAFAGTSGDITEKFPWVLANIEARVLLPEAQRIAACVAKGGSLVLSGILEAEENAVRDAYLQRCSTLRHLETRRRGEGGDGWVAIVFEATG